MPFFVAGTEIGKYKLFSLILFPIYLKLKKEKVLDNRIRWMIFGYIKANQGANYSIIKNELNIPNGQLAYHLSVLEREELISSRKDGLFKRFYPRDINPSNIKEHLTQIRLSIIKIIEKNPGITIKELVIKTGFSRQLLNFHLRILTNANPPYIRTQKEDFKNKFYLNIEFN